MQSRLLNYIAFRAIVKNVRAMRIYHVAIGYHNFVVFYHFWSFLGARLGDIHNVSYITYVAPGFIIMVIITNAYNNVASSFFSERFQNSHQEFIWCRSHTIRSLSAS